jgi:hypothetical protein
MKVAMDEVLNITKDIKVTFFTFSYFARDFIFHLPVKVDVSVSYFRGRMLYQKEYLIIYFIVSMVIFTRQEKN